MVGKIRDGRNVVPLPKSLFYLFLSLQYNWEEEDQREEKWRERERGVNRKIYIAFRPYMEEVLVKVF